MSMPLAAQAQIALQPPVTYFNLISGSGYQSVVVDLDGDPYPDIVAWDYASTQLTLVRGGVTGPVSSQTVSIPIFVENAFEPPLLGADIDGDGDDDIVYAGSAFVYGISVLRNDGGSFTTRIDSSTGSVSGASLRAADLDEDGKLDLLIARSAGQGVSWMKGDGAGGFAAPQKVAEGPNAAMGVGFEIADVDSDGHVDIVLIEGAQVANPARVFLGQGDGSFVLASSFVAGSAGGAAQTRAAFGDLDEDGALDMVIGTSPNVSYDAATCCIRVFKGDGAGGFVFQQAMGVGYQFDVKVVDLDVDGHLDVVSVDPFQRLEFRHGRGDLSFDAVEPFSRDTEGEPYSTPITLADADADGRLDVFAVSRYRALMLRNLAVPSNRVPVTVDESWSLSAGTDIEGALFDTRDPDGQLLTFTLIPNGSHAGSLFVGEGRAFTYWAPSVEDNLDQYLVRVTDPRGATDTFTIEFRTDSSSGGGGGGSLDLLTLAVLLAGAIVAVTRRRRVAPAR